MKRVLISAIAAGALLGQLSAAEIYKDGDKSFGVFGVANALVGYGHNFSKNDAIAGKAKNEFIYGIQGNSRIGINFTVGKLFGAALIGANEPYTGVANANYPGFRQLYAGYDFGDAGKLLAGRNELITSMAGFSSSIFDTESGLNGFGGTSTSTRRFQIAYSIAGLTVSVSENDVNNITTLGNKSVPRFSLGYEYKADGLTAKVAASYTSAQRKYITDIVLVTAGVKADLGGSYVSGLLTYGLNSQLVGENKVANPTLSRGYGNVGVSGNAPLDGNTKKDAQIVGVALEYGANIADDLTFKVGGGYQYATNTAKGDGIKGQLHAYSAFVQLPYSVGGGFSIIPQVGYLGTTKPAKDAEGKTKNVDKGNVLAEVLFKLAF